MRRVEIGGLRGGNRLLVRGGEVGVGIETWLGWVGQMEACLRREETAGIERVCILNSFACHF